SLPFLAYLNCIVRGKFVLFNDSQIRWFFGILSVLATLVLYELMEKRNYEFWDSLRVGLFNITSIMTGTGYASSNFSNWGPVSLVIFFFAMFVGGCAGSTTCGLKIFRIQVLTYAVTNQIRLLLQPHGITRLLYNGVPLSGAVINSVMSFFFMFIVSYCIIVTILAGLGLDFLTAFSGAAAALANVGPGLGDIIGPVGNFASLPDAAKWVLAMAMIIGRLEFFALLVMLSRSFWRG
ncbi:MAG: potassium transporter TrkG, partial [Pseudomonadota bacterium]